MGICNAAGLALAEKHLAGRFNKPDCEIVDHYTYSIMGDGCNMEGMSGEGASSRLTGSSASSSRSTMTTTSPSTATPTSFTEDVCARYEAYGWHVQHVEDGNTDLDAIRKAVEAAKKDPRPSLIKVTTPIGYGSPNKSNTHDVHGAPRRRRDRGYPREPRLEVRALRGPRGRPEGHGLHREGCRGPGCLGG